MNARYEAIANKGIASMEAFLLKFNKTLSPTKVRELQEAIEKKKKENLTAHFASLPDIRSPFVVVMRKPVFQGLDPEAMADYCEAYSEMHDALKRSVGSGNAPVDLSGVVNENSYFSGTRVDVSDSSKARKLTAALKACPKIANPVTRLPSYGDVYQALDKKVCYDVSKISDDGKYPPFYVFNRQEVALKENEIKAKKHAEALRATQRKKWMRLFLMVVLPALVAIAFAAGLAVLLDKTLFLIPGWGEGAYSGLWTVLAASVGYLILAVGSHFIAEGIPSDILRDYGDYDAVKTLGLIISGVARIAIVFLVPALIQDAVSYWGNVATGLIVSGAGFLFQFFFQPRGRTFYVFLVLEIIGEVFLMVYVPQHMMVLVDDGLGQYTRNFGVFLLFAAVLLSLFSYGSIAKDKHEDLRRGTVSLGEYFGRYAVETFYQVILPLLLLLLGLGMQEWTKTWFYLWHENYLDGAGSSFALWGYITLDIIYILLFVAFVSGALGAAWAPIQGFLDPDRTDFRTGLKSRVFWTVFSAYLATSLLVCSFGGWYTQMLNGRVITFIIIAAVPFLAMPFYFATAGPRRLGIFRFVSRPYPFDFAAIVFAVVFPMITMLMANANPAIGLSIYATVFVIATSYGGSFLTYFMENF